MELQQSCICFEVETKRLVKFRSAKDEIQSRLSETTPYTILTFMKCADVSNSLSKLFGKLIQKNRQIGTKMGAAVSYNTNLHKIMENGAPIVSAKTKATTTTKATAFTSRNHKGSNTEACSQQQIARPMNPSGKTIETVVPIVTDISNNQSDAGARKATENVLLRRVSGQIAKVGPLKDGSGTKKPAGSSDHLSGPLNEMVKNTQPTVEALQVTESNTIPAVNIGKKIPQGMNSEVANNQPAENSTVYNQTSANNVQPAVNAPGSTGQTTSILNSQTIEPLLSIKTVPPAVNAASSSNKQSVESGSVVNQPSISITIQPAVNTVANRQSIKNNTSKDSGGSNTTCKLSKDPRKSRSRLYGESIDSGGNDDSEPVAKKARLEPTPDEDSQTNHQGSWQGKVQQNLLFSTATYCEMRAKARQISANW